MDNIELKSLEEVAVEVLRETKEKATYLELFNKVAELKNFTEEERKGSTSSSGKDNTSSSGKDNTSSSGKDNSSSSERKDRLSRVL